MLQVNVRGANDEGLVRELLEFGRRCSSGFIGTTPHSTSLEGFQYEGSPFDAVGVAAPAVHGYHAHGEEHDNTRTRSHSIGRERGLTQYATLHRELGLLDSAEGSYVEWENRHGEVRHADWAGGVCTVDLGGGERRGVTIAGLQELGRADVHR